MICLFIYLLSNLSIHLPFIYSFVYHPAIHLTAHPSIVSINHRFTLSIYLEFMYLYPSSIYLRSIHLSAIYVSVSIHPSNCPSIHCIYQTSSPHLLSIYLHYLHIYIYLYIFHSLIHHLVYQYIYLSHIYLIFINFMHNYFTYKLIGIHQIFFPILLCKLKKIKMFM